MTRHARVAASTSTTPDAATVSPVHAPGGLARALVNDPVATTAIASSTQNTRRALGVPAVGVVFAGVPAVGLVRVRLEALIRPFRGGSWRP
jgi:hypothetical protein